MFCIAESFLSAMSRPRESWNELERKAYEIISGPMTQEQRRAQVISFVYGNVGIENPDLTRRDVERAYGRLYTN